MWTHRVLFIHCFNLLPVLILMLESSQIWPVTAPFKLLSLFFCCVLISFEHYFWNEVSHAYRALSHQPWDRSFLQGSLVPFSEETYLATKIWVPGILITVGLALLPDRVSAELGNMYVWMCALNLHTHVVTPVFISVSVYILKTASSCRFLQSQSNTTRSVLVFFLPTFVIAFLTVKLCSLVSSSRIRSRPCV